MYEHGKESYRKTTTPMLITLSMLSNSNHFWLLKNNVQRLTRILYESKFHHYNKDQEVHIDDEETIRDASTKPFEQKPH